MVTSITSSFTVRLTSTLINFKLRNLVINLKILPHSRSTRRGSETRRRRRGPVPGLHHLSRHSRRCYLPNTRGPVLHHGYDAAQLHRLGPTRQPAGHDEPGLWVNARAPLSPHASATLHKRLDVHVVPAHDALRDGEVHDAVRRARPLQLR